MEGDAYDDGVNEREESENDLRGLIMDWGGVLTASLDGAMSAWAAHDQIDYEHFRAVLRVWAPRPPGNAGGADTSDAPDTPVADLEQADDDGPAGNSPVHRLERGELSVPDFEHALATELARRGSSVAAAGLLTRMLSGLQTLDRDMITMVRTARSAGVRTALLSNSWGDHYPESLWDGLFDVVVISGRVGMRKPEPEIFQHTCTQLDLAPKRCVMVDDLPHNVEAAAAVGMVAVEHHSYAETVTRLEDLFGFALRHD
jgi:epoxide hydrolase-like predicted phosphatase